MEIGYQQYERLTEAVKFYRQAGFRYIDVPWDVTPEISSLTKPEGCRDFPLTETSVLVASAEQSFLQIYDKIQTDGIYMSITPCFRDEPVIDDLHQRYFMKLELFSIDYDNYIEMIYHAQRFFKTILDTNPVRKYSDEYNCDLMLRNIELGSYGVRTVGGLSYSFGTGLAEPRMSQALTYKKSSTRTFAKTPLPLTADAAHNEAWEIAQVYMDYPHLKNIAV